MQIHTISSYEVERVELLSIKRVLKCFEVMSGLKINFYKSVVCRVGISDNEVNEFPAI